MQMKHQRIESIDFIKGLAIFGIVLHHLISRYLDISSVSLLGKLINSGSNLLGGGGDRVFFFCSGLGLYYSYLRKKIKYIDFLKRRFLKIYIPYIVTVLIYFISPFQFTNNDTFRAFMSHVFLYKMFIPRYMSTFGVFWFVSTLFQFYLLFYGICWFRNRFSKWYMFYAICVLIGLIWQIAVFAIYGNTFVRVLNGSAVQYLPVFALGMVAAELIYTGEIKNYPINKRNLGLVAIAFLTIDLFMVMGPIKILGAFNDLPDTIGFISLLMFTYQISSERIRSVFVNISDFGYEWYLVHIIIMTLCFSIIGGSTILHVVIASLTSIIGSAFFAYLYHKLWNRFYQLVKL